MRQYIARKVLTSLLTLFLGSIVVFLLLRLAPGDPASAMADADATPAQLQAIREQLGLDRPPIQQYIDWIGGLLTGAPGNSFKFAQPITELVARAAGSTLELALVGAAMLLVGGVVIGILLTQDRPRWLRSCVETITTISLSMPVYVSAVLLIFVFAVVLRWLPSGGQISLLEAPDLSVQYLVMPAFAMALSGSTVLGRLLATEARRVRQEEFVLTAVAKGAPPRRVTRRHILPNSVSPFIVEYGIRIGDLIGGAVIAEVLFARHGLGKLLLDAVVYRDYPLAQTLLMLAIAVAITTQLLTELLLVWADPRTRTGVAA